MIAGRSEGPAHRRSCSGNLTSRIPGANKITLQSVPEANRFDH
jgi:hypothetical protein